MNSRTMRFALLLALAWCLPLLLSGQDKSPTAAPPGVDSDYPHDLSGVLIHGSYWQPIANQVPFKNRAKHALAPAFTYGIAPAEGVSEYEGLHATVQVPPGRPVICVCRVLGLPGNPVLVRLHPKKTSRELDMGKVHFGTKMEEAEKNDLIPTSVSQPENGFWLVQPQDALPAGEYALMLGTGNVSIVPFTVAASTPPASPPAP